MKLLGNEISPLGMGCWPIGGPMYVGDVSKGYTGADDTASRRTIDAAYDAGIRVFDTAAAYGAGHSEFLLRQSLHNRPDSIIITKIGIRIDEASKHIGPADTDTDSVLPAIEGCLRRLDRECIDIVLLHLNSHPIDEAMPLFDEMERAHAAGKIRAYGWSTDYSDRVMALDGRDNVVAIEHAMNVFFDAARIQSTCTERGLATLIRSPLAMGLLSGKYDASTQIPRTDVRGTDEEWLSWFQNGRPNPKYLDRLGAVRDLLQSDGRSLVQGALSWLWAKKADNIPVPGAKSEAQIIELASALEFGPLPPEAMDEIETLIPRDPDYVETDR